jgi:soluble lytic murein transglycosylase-like protein
VPTAATLTASAPWRSVVREAAASYHLSEALLLSVIEVESEFDHLAVSSSGALGLMQLLPSTALELGVLEPFDGRQNIFGGAAYLRLLAGQLGPDLVVVLAGYNAGPGTVRRWGGVPAIDKTQRYVSKVLAAYDRWRNAGVS